MTSLLLCLAALQAHSEETTLESISVAAAQARIYQQPICARMEFFANQLLGTPYVGFTLDQEPANEECTVTLKGLDCVTFMETVFALARTPKPTLESLRKAVTQTRYWDGKVNGYASRLHYTTDWFFENDRRKNVKDMSGAFPSSAPFERKVSYMSSHPDRYAALRAHPEFVEKIKATEDLSNARKKFYIPISELAEAEKSFQSGDIIGLCGGAEGIDISHVGMIIVKNGVPHFVDANSKTKKVQMETKLSDFLRGSKTEGVIVARPLENLKRR